MKIDFTEIFCHVDDFFRELDAKTNFITDKNNCQLQCKIHH